MRRSPLVGLEDSACGAAEAAQHAAFAFWGLRSQFATLKKRGPKPRFQPIDASKNLPREGDSQTYFEVVICDLKFAAPPAYRRKLDILKTLSR